MPFDHFAAIAPLYARATYFNIDVLSEVADLPVNGVLLDVGGGTGRVASAIRDLINEVFIADISLGMLKHTSRESFKLVCSCSEAIPFSNESFDRVLMVDALHHVMDQRATASELLRVAKQGGIIVIEEPDIRALGVKLIAAIEKMLFMRSRFLAPDKIVDLFDGQVKKIKVKDGTAWIVIKKKITQNA